MCLYAHQHFLESEVTFWDVCFRVLYPLTVHWKKAQFSSKTNIPKKIFEGNSFPYFFLFFYYSHPDCLKLPHGEKQSENVEFKSELTKIKTISFQVDLGLNGRLCFGLLSLPKVL